MEHTREAASCLVNVIKESAATVIETIGEESKTLVPGALGVIAVLVLVALKVLVDYFWKKQAKQEMLKAGRNPRSNDAAIALVKELNVPSIRDRVDIRYGMPNLRPASDMSVEENVANQQCAMLMFNEEIKIKELG